MRALSPWILAAAVACRAHVATQDSAPVPAAPEEQLSMLLSQADLVDLSHAYDASTLYWPTSPSAFELDTLAEGPSPAGFTYNANAFCTPEHGGTHLDAPLHFAAGAQATDEVPLQTLVAPAVVIDVSAHAEANPDYRLTPDDVVAWETEHGRVPDGAMVLLHTGWAQRWPDRLAYFGDDTPGDASNLHFPSFGAAAVELLLEERGAGLLGLDTPSIDYGPSDHFPVHQAAGHANVPGLENLTNLDQLPATGAWVMALPMKIAGGSGGPARVVALVP